MGRENRKQLLKRWVTCRALYGPSLCLALGLLLASCAQRQHTEYCNLSDVLTCSLNYSTAEEVRACVNELTGNACELSEDTVDQINSDIAASSGSYTCNTIEEWQDKVLAKGFSLTRVNTAGEKTIYVDTFRSLFKDYTEFAVTRTIQDAIDLSETGTHIVICPGHYYENLSLTGTAHDGITVSNLADGDVGLAEFTIVEGLLPSPVLEINGALDITVTGLTLQNGTADYGAGISVHARRDDANGYDDVSLKNLVIQDNVATFTGGGLYSEGNIGVQGTGLMLRRNQALIGGGIGMGGQFDGRKSFSLTDSSLEDNAALALGPAVYVEKADTLILQNVSLAGQYSYVTDLPLPAIHLADTAHLYGVNVDWHDGSLANEAGDIFNVVELANALPQGTTIEWASFDWSDWQQALSDLLTAQADLQTLNETISQQSFIYDYVGANSLACNLYRSWPACVVLSDTQMTAFLVNEPELDTAGAAAVSITGIITSPAEVQSFTWQLGDGALVDVLSDTTHHLYEFTVSGLAAGANIVTLVLIDNAGLSTTQQIVVNYQVPVVVDDEMNGDESDTVAGTDTETATDTAVDTDDSPKNSWWSDIFSALWEFFTADFNSIAFTVEDPVDTHESGNKLSLTNHSVRGQINKIEEILNQLMPDLARAQGLDGIHIDATTTIVSGYENGLFCNYSWKLKSQDMAIWPEIDSSNIQSEFSSGNKVALSFTSAKASMTAKLHFYAYAPSILCPEIEADFDITGTGLDFAVEFLLQVNSSTHEIVISSVEDVEFVFTTVEINNLGWWEGAWMGTLFNPDSSELKKLGKDKLADGVKDALNDFFGHVWKFSGQVDEPAALSFDVALTDIDTTSSGFLQSEWDLDIDFEKDKHSCAQNLTWNDTTENTTTAIPSWGQFSNLIPLSVMRHTIYGLGKTGVFCKNLALDLGAAGSLLVEVYPAGEIALAPAENSSTSMLQLKIPFGMEFSNPEETAESDSENTSPSSMAGRISPVQISPDVENLKLSPRTQTLPDVTFNVVFGLSIDVNCRAGLALRIDSIMFEDVSGEVSFDGLTLSITDLDPLLAYVNSLFTANFKSIELMPKILDVKELGNWAVEIDEVGVDETALYLGLNIVEEDYCSQLTD